MVPLMMPRTAVTRLAPRSQTSGPSSGTPPATAASKRRPTPASRAAVSRVAPSLASSSLLALTTDFPAAKASRMASARGLRATHQLDHDVDVFRRRDGRDVVGESDLRGQLQLPLSSRVSRRHGDEHGWHMAAGDGVGSPVRVEQPGGHGRTDRAEAQQPDTPGLAHGSIRGQRPGVMGIHLPIVAQPRGADRLRLPSPRSAGARDLRRASGPAMATGRTARLLAMTDSRPSTTVAAPVARGRVFSGVQPSGLPHVGNHLGAFSNYIAMQDGYEAIYCIVDYHALTSTHDAELIRRNTREMALGLLALGLDPERAVLFRQSDRPEHIELMWLLASVTPTGWVERTPSFKEKKRHQPDDVNLALLCYPVLQAADIAIYKASYVPVGKDQAAHLELAREIVRAFNARYGETFPEPAGRLLRGAHREGHGRRQQDVQVARQCHRDLRRRGRHPPADHEHGH